METKGCQTLAQVFDKLSIKRVKVDIITHTKVTLDKKILSPLLPRFEIATF